MGPAIAALLVRFDRQAVALLNLESRLPQPPGDVQMS